MNSLPSQILNVIGKQLPDMMRFFFIFNSLFLYTSLKSQELDLEVLIDYFSMPTKHAVSQLQTKGWHLRKTVKTENHVDYFLDYVTKENDTLILFFPYNSGKKSLAYIAIRQSRYDSLLSSAFRTGFQTLFFQDYKTGKHLALQRDSSIIIYFMKNGDTTSNNISYEIGIMEFKSWLTGFWASRQKGWNEKDKYSFMIKCIDKKGPSQLRDMITVCSCGGAIIEKSHHFKDIIVLDKRDLYMIFGPCLNYFKFDLK
jgi:hypothetical protein